MLLNLLFLSGTILLIYIGYTYKAIAIFLVGMILDDIYSLFYKIKTPKMKYNEQRNRYSLKFFLGNQEYILIVPSFEEKESKKILAISGSSNKTTYLTKIMGPNQNFFGSKLTPKNIGLNKLKIWRDKKYYIFNEDDIIDLENYSPPLDSDTEEDVETTETTKSQENGIKEE